MELRQLRYFVAVAEELHFRRAAERLHMSQPPLSQQIRALETELGAELFVRSRRRVELTPAGAALLEDARRILTSVEDAADHVRRIERGEIGRLSVGFVGSATYGALPEILRAFRAAHPAVDLRLRELTTPEQVDALRQGSIDLGVLRPPGETPELETELLERERVVVALPAAHPLALRPRLRLADLADEPFVLLSRREGPGLRDATARAVAQTGGAGHVVQEVAEMQTVIGLVAAGLGVSIVPASVGARGRHDVTFRELVGDVPTVDLVLAWRPEATSPLREAFVTAARAVSSSSSSSARSA